MAHGPASEFSASPNRTVQHAAHTQIASECRCNKAAAVADAAMVLLLLSCRCCSMTRPVVKTISGCFNQRGSNRFAFAAKLWERSRTDEISHPAAPPCYIGRLLIAISSHHSFSGEWRWNVCLDWHQCCFCAGLYLIDFFYSLGGYCTRWCVNCK